MDINKFNNEFPSFEKIFNSQLSLQRKNKIIEQRKTNQPIINDLLNISFSIGATTPIQLDGGAQRSVLTDKSLFDYIEPSINNANVFDFKGNFTKIEGVGRALGLRNVNFIPTSRLNIISEFDLKDEGYILSISDDNHRIFTHWEDNSKKWIFREFDRKWLLSYKSHCIDNSTHGK
jgi:hypothetical protein